jgi:hypothetical protein
MTQTTQKVATRKKENTTTTSNIAVLDEYTGMVQLAQKMFQVKNEIGSISKGSTNPFYNSKYFDINDLLHHVEPILHNHRLMCLQPVIDGKVYTQIVDVDSGYKYESWIEMPHMDDPQKLGSAIKYFRRYTLASLLSMQSLDDDGNKAKPKTTQQNDPQTRPTAKTLTAEQFKLAMESDAKGVDATIKHIESGKIKASSNQINKLKIQLEKLTK